MAAMTADGSPHGTVEWGDDRPARWFDRLLGGPAEAGPFGLGLPSLGAAILALVLVVAAELVPWMTINANQSADFGQIGLNGREIYLSGLGGPLAAYYLGWMLLLALVGVGQVIGPAYRRPVIGLGLGVAAGLLTLVVGLGHLAATGDVGFPFFLESKLGPGAFVAVAGVLAGAAAVGLTGWRPGYRVRAPAGARGRPMRYLEPDQDPGPADLTVTPLQ
jgi:hypothetical protein